MKIIFANIKIIIAFSVITLLITSCKKFLEIPPPSYQLVGEKIFTSDATATSAIVGMYSDMMLNQNQFCASAVTLYAGLYSDEMIYYTSSDRDEFIISKLTQSSQNFLSSAFWAPAYKYIYTANICIEKLANSTTITPAVKERLIGEAKFIRAFSFFYLAELFGDVPLTLTSDYKVNQSLGRSSYSEVLDQIILDLKDAKALLPEQYISTERIRPNKWAAASLLARVYLYTEKWEEAKREATEIINSGLYQLSSNLNNVFLKESPEAIWQLQPVNPNWNTWEGKEILFETISAPPTYILRESLVNSFESGDKRKDTWTASRVYLGENVYYPNKYKQYGNNAPVTEYYLVFRLAELYLIRAEANLNLNDLSNVPSDINRIRERADLENISVTSSKENLYTTIKNERRHEFFAEWGHRFLDLKRWKEIDAVMSSLKPTTWNNFRQLWPVPYNQINANPNLTQNPGY